MPSERFTNPSPPKTPKIKSTLAGRGCATTPGKRGHRVRIIKDALSRTLDFEQKTDEDRETVPPIQNVLEEVLPGPSLLRRTHKNLLQDKDPNSLLIKGNTLFVPDHPSTSDSSPGQDIGECWAELPRIETRFRIKPVIQRTRSLQEKENGLKLNLKEDCRIVVIGDSNLARITHTPREDIQIFSYPGVQTPHLSVREISN